MLIWGWLCICSNPPLVCVHFSLVIFGNQILGDSSPFFCNSVENSRLAIVNPQGVEIVIFADLRTDTNFCQLYTNTHRSRCEILSAESLYLQQWGILKFADGWSWLAYVWSNWVWDNPPRFFVIPIQNPVIHIHFPLGDRHLVGPEGRHFAVSLQ